MGAEVVGRRRFGWFAAGALLVVAVFYFAAPFSIRVEPVDLPARLRTVPTPDRVRADCSGPWRQVVSPPSIYATTDTKSDPFTEVEHNRQPLCENTGRSRALFSGWLLLAALAVVVVVRPTRHRRTPRNEGTPGPDAGVVDLV